MYPLDLGCIRSHEWDVVARRDCSKNRSASSVQMDTLLNFFGKSSHPEPTNTKTHHPLTSSFFLSGGVWDSYFLMYLAHKLDRNSQFAQVPFQKLLLPVGLIVFLMALTSCGASRNYCTTKAGNYNTINR